MKTPTTKTLKHGRKTKVMTKAQKVNVVLVGIWAVCSIITLVASVLR